LSERAVYEAFGNPQGVSIPGLHVYLPWPFGRLKPVEYGVVHQIPIAFLDEEIYGKAIAEKTVVGKSTIEGEAAAAQTAFGKPRARPKPAPRRQQPEWAGKFRSHHVDLAHRLSYRADR